MTRALHSAFTRDIDALAVPGLLIDCRVIRSGDEKALSPQEAASIPSQVLAARRASGAARIVARALLARLGFPDAQVPRDEGGAPLWPAGVVGSLAHDDEIALAAVAMARDFAGIGIDVEPAKALPAGMLDLVASTDEQRGIAGNPLKARLLFAAKEAVYKAAYPLDRVFLEFSDIAVDLVANTAMTRTGRKLTLRSCISSRVVALALVHA